MHCVSTKAKAQKDNSFCAFFYLRFNCAHILQKYFSLPFFFREYTDLQGKNNDSFL